MTDKAEGLSQPAGTPLADGGDGERGTGSSAVVGNIDSAPAPPPSDEPETPLGALRGDIAALFDDARTYAAAEVAFQKTRATTAGKKAGMAFAYLVLALLLFHIALIALAVGIVIALAPLVTIWGAIAIVVGALLAGTAALLLRSRSEGKTLGALFEPGKPE